MADDDVIDEEFEVEIEGDLDVDVDELDPDDLDVEDAHVPARVPTTTVSHH